MMRVRRVGDTVVVEMTAREAQAVAGAVSYYNMAVGFDNFEMGYHGPEDREERRGHAVARSFAKKVGGKADV